jgi:hypothetical protein
MYDSGVLRARRRRHVGGMGRRRSAMTGHRPWFHERCGNRVHSGVGRGRASASLLRWRRSIRIEKADDPLGLLERLNQPIEQNALRNNDSAPDTILWYPKKEFMPAS